MAFKPTDINSPANCVVMWLSAQGDPYANSSQNPGGCYADTGAPPTKQAVPGDRVKRLKDFSLPATSFHDQATVNFQPFLRMGRNGPHLRFQPQNNEYTGLTDTTSDTTLPGQPTRIRITDLDQTTGTLDIYDPVAAHGFTARNIVTNGVQTAYCDGISDGYMHYRTPLMAVASSWAVGDTLTWTDNGGQAKSAVVAGSPEARAHMDGPSVAIANASGAGSGFFVARLLHTVTQNKACIFAHGNATGALAFGLHFDSSNTPRLSLFINGTQFVAPTLCPSHSIECYWYNVTAAGVVTIGMGDRSELAVLANGSAGTATLLTSSAITRIGAYNPGTSNQWPAAMDFYSAVVIKRDVTANELANLLAHFRAVHNFRAYTGAVHVIGNSITAGFNAPNRWWEYVDVEQFGRELRVNALPNDTYANMLTAMSATTGVRALTAPHISTFARNDTILCGPTNDYAGTPGDVDAAIAGLKSLIVKAKQQGSRRVWLCTDTDKYTGSSQWQTDADAGNPRIRQLGFPVIDWAADTRLGGVDAAQNPLNFFAQYVHPSEQGHRLMGAVAARKVEPVFYAETNGLTSGRTGRTGRV